MLAQDPSILVRGKALTARISVPFEMLTPGPCGHRVQVIDYDSTTDRLFAPHRRINEDPFEKVTDVDTLVADAHFHQQNVYAIVMSTLARFERALGRRVSWGFGSHQIKVAPHAFADPNAFYSKTDQALVFGYFSGRSGTVHSCLSHDVVAHESTHALIDGIRERYTDDSSPDQAAFHEGFADVVALLSVLALKETVEAALDLSHWRARTIPRAALTERELRAVLLLGVAEQMGQELQMVRGGALRQSAKLPPSPDYLAREEFQEPHRRGEVFVAAMMNSFIAAWISQLEHPDYARQSRLDRAKVAQEGADAADRLLTMAIRALDYTPTVDLQFGDFLSALLTADVQLVPDDSRYRYRGILRKTFAAYGILPTSHTRGGEPGLWEPPDKELNYTATHSESMQRDATEIFRFLWENRKCLGLAPDPYTKVLSVRPTQRVGPDGFFVHETVAEYVQTVAVRASTLGRYGIRKPKGMPLDLQVRLYGGGALIFDEYGRLKFHVRNRLLGYRQQGRLDYLWDSGALVRQTPASLHFSAIHRLRAGGRNGARRETW